MSRRASIPLDAGAVKAADDAFYAAHPEMIDSSGRRIPIDPSSPAHAAYRSEWMDLYVAAGGPLVGDDPAPPDGPIEPCPTCWIKFQFLSKDGDFPLQGVRALITDPNGVERDLSADAQGVIAIAPAIPGGYALTMLLDGLTISQVFSFETQNQAGVPVTASQSPPPTQTPAHAEDAQARGAPPPADDNAARSDAFPWHPVVLAKVETRPVADGDSLVSLAAELGWTWQQLARFNFGTDQPEQVNSQLRDLIGCTKSDARGNYSFQGSDDPGLMFLPRPLEAQGLAINMVHVFRGAPVKRPAKLEVQTVDELGYRVGGIALRLVRVDGSEETITTNGDGYWTDTLLVEGPLDIYHPGGERAVFFSDRYTGRDQRGDAPLGIEPPQFARLDPLLVRRAISDVLVPGAVGEGVLARRDVLRRRYGRTRADVQAASAVAEPTGDQAGESGGRGDGQSNRAAGAVTVRSQFRAVDNVFATAYVGVGSGGNAMITRFMANLDSWLNDKHPTTIAASRGYYLMLVLGKHMLIATPKGGGQIDVKAQYELGGEYSVYSGEKERDDGTVVELANPYGAYACFETSLSDLPLFFDLESRSFMLISFSENRTDNSTICVWDLCKAEADRDKARALMQSLSPRVGVLYLHPPDEDQRHIAAFWGCSGLLENYPRDAGVNARVHQRNLDVVASTDYAYRSYLAGYIQGVKATPSAEKLQEHGPPLEPFRYATPAGASDEQMMALYHAARATSYPAWQAVSDHLADLEDRHTSGSIFFRTKFEITGTGASKVGGGAGKLAFNFDIGTDGYLQKTERAVEVALGPNEVKIPGSLQAAGTAQYKVEVNADTGERKETIALALKRGPHSYGIESSSDGNVKFTGPYNSYSEWNQRTAEGGFGYCLSLQDLIGKRKDELKEAEKEGLALPSNVLDRVIGKPYESVPNATFCFGLHFVLLREDQVLAYLVRAPGFFERRLLNQLLKCNWNSLSGYERAQLTVIGWEIETWDRRAPGDFPAATGKDYSELPAGEQIAAVKLGFTQINWSGVWLAELNLAKQRETQRSSGR